MFCDNTRDDIMREMAQWQVDGELTGDDDIAPDGCFYDEAQAEIVSALIQGGFPQNFDNSKPIAKAYVASMHRKLTALLYIQAHRLNILTDGSDPTRGMWGNIRAKLAKISRGEPFGELKAPRGSVQTAMFCGDICCGMSCNRSL